MRQDGCNIYCGLRSSDCHNRRDLPLHESIGRRPLGGGRIRSQEPDGRQLRRLLRPCRERPRRCAAECCDELSPPDHSITSSASASSDGGTVRPSILAVSALITSSNFDDWTTGSSAG